jgi:hypothetical protein
MSQALARWKGERCRALDEIEAAHRAVEGRRPGRGRRARPGRRYATLRVNHSYLVLLAGHFQGFCRDLHSEAADWLAAHVDPAIGDVLRPLLTSARQLDKGNANPGTLGADFGRFFPTGFWDEVDGRYTRCDERKKKLDELNQWRNAVAHQDFAKVGGSDRLRLLDVQAWRAVCSALAPQFDAVLKSRLRLMVGAAPW